MKNFINKMIKKYCTKEVIMYLIFGVLTTVVSYATFYLFDKLLPNVDVSVINVISWIFAVVFAYFTNKLFVFESKSFKASVLAKEIVTFASARVISLLFETGFIVVTVDIFGMNKMLSKIVASVFVVIMNYFASKLLIFKKGKDDETI